MKVCNLKGVFMKAVILATSLLTVAGCSSPRTTDYLDAGTTLVALSGGAVEANPVFGITNNNPLGTGVAVLAAKAVGRTVVDQIIPEGQREQSHLILDGFSVGAACNNLGVIAGISNPLPVGIVCGITYYITQNRR